MTLVKRSGYVNDADSVNSARHNMSCDLRPLALVLDKGIFQDPVVNNFLQRVVFTGKRCTPEITDVVPGGPIRNVIEAELALRDLARFVEPHDGKVRVSGTQRIHFS
jgi:hypothetical protein